MTWTTFVYEYSIYNPGIEYMKKLTYTIQHNSFQI